MHPDFKILTQDMASRPKPQLIPRRYSNAPHQTLEDEDDIWYHKEKLCKEHIQEVLAKWKQIDDEIWAKVVVFEKNRRVAKAYARAPVLTVNGSDEDFDGFRIGLNGFDSPMKDRRTEEFKRHVGHGIKIKNGFDSPMKDRRTEEFKRHVGHGIKIKMDEAGNILLKRVSKCNIYVKNLSLDENAIGNEILKLPHSKNLSLDENAIGNEILKLPHSALPSEKPLKLFDMVKFQNNLKRELRRAYPDRKRLENQCLSAVAFVKNEEELLDCPIWILIINVVAIEMLKAKLPPTERIDIKDRPRIPIPEEDPYSLPGRSNNTLSAKLQYRGEKPPRLPPREIINKSNKEKEKEKEKKQYEDPYYHGLRARVSSFVSKTKSKLKKPPPALNYPSQPPQYEAPTPQGPQRSNGGRNTFAIHQHPMWYTRSVESGIDTDFTESPYNKIYGKLPVPRGYIPQHRIVHIGDWD
ncbi:MH2 domain [Popillia japonica]|uniref:MH2 domain n=1 Tax=Popillia japonica TaxID=7064 RepID=A0AAW1N261_POPJA